jgi:hypothetical protein
MNLLHVLDPAERPSGRHARLLRRQASTLVVGGEQFQMRADFFIEPRVEGAMLEQRSYPRP